MLRLSKTTLLQETSCEVDSATNTARRNEYVRRELRVYVRARSFGASFLFLTSYFVLGRA